MKEFYLQDYADPCAVDFVNPDFQKIAESCNLDNYKVKTSQEFENAFKKAQINSQSAIIEVIVDESLTAWECV